MTNVSYLLVLEEAVFSPGKWICFPFTGTVNQGLGKVSGGSQIKLLYTVFFITKGKHNY